MKTTSETSLRSSLEDHKSVSLSGIHTLDDSSQIKDTSSSPRHSLTSNISRVSSVSDGSLGSDLDLSMSKISFTSHDSDTSDLQQNSIINELPPVQFKPTNTSYPSVTTTTAASSAFTAMSTKAVTASVSSDSSTPRVCQLRTNRASQESSASTGSTIDRTIVKNPTNVTTRRGTGRGSACLTQTAASEIRTQVFKEPQSAEISVSDSVFTSPPDNQTYSRSQTDPGTLKKDLTSTPKSQQMHASGDHRYHIGAM